MQWKSSLTAVLDGSTPVDDLSLVCCLVSDHASWAPCHLQVDKYLLRCWSGETPAFRPLTGKVLGDGGHLRLQLGVCFDVIDIISDDTTVWRYRVGHCRCRACWGVDHVRVEAHKGSISTKIGGRLIRGRHAMGGEHGPVKALNWWERQWSARR